MSRVVLHLDMNAYFASVEQKANPALRGRPVAVVGDLKRRSIVLTASYEARAFGVKTGNLYWDARRLCHGLIPVVGDPRKYVAQTREIVRVLEDYSDQVEVASIDEGYLDVTGSLKLFKTDGLGVARRLQARIKDELGLPCSVGAAPNKLLAKLASGLRKPMGLYEIRPEDVAGLLAELPVEELCGIGPRLKESLNRLGIRTCGQLGAAPLDLLQAEFGFWGYWMRRWGRGEDESPVRRSTELEAVKSVGHSTTLPQDTSDPEVVRSFMLLLAEKVGVRLRRGGLMGRTVSASCRYDDFRGFSKSRTLDEPLCDGPALCGVALDILHEMRPERPLRQLGVCVSSLVLQESPPFLLEHLEKGRLAAQAMDEVNEEFGRGTLKRAGVLEAERFGVLEAPSLFRMP
ncbi:MAG TPA: DNA polymerase IV [Elusimicrobia bacterium]|nr:DNA polymerase IV [Elusimicrobiota bacterium]